MNYEQWKNARTVCVCGAGTMGSGIAAHLANLGFEVTLLDVSLEAAEAGLDRARHARPPHFFTPSKADSIQLGSLEEDQGAISKADWVCEAIVEDLDAKRAFFEQIEECLGSETMVSTNTSGLPVEDICANRSESFRARFMGTHFFNPPRYLKLLELVPTQFTDPKAVKAMSSFLEEKVARRVVQAKDTPGFIANRFGMWAIFNAIHVTERLRLCIEDVDAITGQFMGRPRSGTFRLCDIIGLDVMQSIAKNLIERCPGDPFIGNMQPPSSLDNLLSKNWLGDKTGRGYYKKEGKELVAFDLQTMAYRMKRDVSYPSLAKLATAPIGERLATALDLRDEVGEFTRLHFVPLLRYAAFLSDTISHSVLDFDHVLKWGFGWELGPFGLIDAVGPAKLGLSEKPFYQKGKYRSFDGTYRALPKHAEYRPLADYPLVDQRDGFNVRDLGESVTAICLTTKMGTINPRLVDGLIAFFSEAKFERFVLTSEGRSFSAGYDLRYISERIADDDKTAIEEALKNLQQFGDMLSQKPGVAAVFGHCLGAGLEIAARCSSVAAGSDTQIGLPESRIGLIPGGGGTALMRIRNQHLGARGLSEVLVRLAEGVTCANPDEARELGYLRPTDVTVYHPDRLIYDAKALALNAEVGQEEELMPMPGPLPGMIDTLLSQRRQRGEFTEYDEQIGLKLKTVFSKASSFEDALERERQVFLDLCGRNLTALRIKHMLETGKTLRN